LYNACDPVCTNKLLIVRTSSASIILKLPVKKAIFN